MAHHCHTSRSVDATSSLMSHYMTCPKYISLTQNRRCRSMFSVLNIIVNFLKARHHQNDTEPCAIEDILDETSLLYLDVKAKEWLVKEALPHNSKVEVIEGKYLFKSPLPITDKRSLLKLLQYNNAKGLGGIMLSDVQECLGPKWKKIRKQVEGEVLQVVRRMDKKIIVFHKDKSLSLQVSEELVQIWRRLSVSDTNVTDKEIDTYLLNQGFKTMQIVKEKITKPNKIQKPSRSYRIGQKRY